MGGSEFAPKAKEQQGSTQRERPDDDVTQRAASPMPHSSAGPSLKILMVAEDFPWPSLGGGSVRLVKMIEALTSLGELDLLTLYDRRRAVLDVPESVNLRRLKTLGYPDEAASWRWRARWFLHRGVPIEVEMRCSDTTTRRALMSWADDQYDLVWFSTAALFHWMGRPRLGPTIVDFIDLEDEKEFRRARILKSETPSSGLGRIRHALALAGSTECPGLATTPTFDCLHR